MEAIYAVDLCDGLSKDGVIAWKSVKDLRFFQAKTLLNVVIMGKNTYLSLPPNVRPLKKRLNIVLTNQPEKYSHISDNYDNVLFTDNANIHEHILANREVYLQHYPVLHEKFTVFIIGGKTIYEKYLPLCDRVWVTKLKQDYFCDLFLHYDYSKEFLPPQIIEDDEELIMYKYDRIGYNPST